MKQIDIKELIPYLKDGWVAMDRDGTWWLYNEKPEMMCIFGTTTPYGWCFIRKRTALSNIAPVSDWTKSLIKVENKDE